MKAITVMLALFTSLFLHTAGAQLAHAQPTWYLPTGDGCKLLVQEFGTGVDTVIVLHGGWGAEHSYLFDAFKGFEQKYHFVFYDQRGSLLSPCPADKISVQNHVDDLDLLRKTLGLEQMSIAAHSMGTFLAMTYQQQHPDHVRGLVLMGSSIARTPKTDMEKQRKEEQENGIHMRATDLSTMEPEFQKLGLDIKEAKAWTPQQQSLAWHVSMASANLYHLDRWRQLKGGGAFYNAEAGQAAAKTMPAAWDFVPVLAARSCPTWVIDGDHDYVTDPAGKMFHAATEQVSGVHVVSIHDAGHNAWIDAPVEFRRALETALSDAKNCARNTKTAHR